MRYFLANYAVPHPPKKENYAARSGKFLQNVRPGAVNFSKYADIMRLFYEIVR